MNWKKPDDKLRDWQKSLINNYTMGEISKVKYHHKPIRTGANGYKRGELKDISKEINDAFDKEWEEAKELILAERSKFE